MTIAKRVAVRYAAAVKWKRNKATGKHTEVTLSKGRTGWEVKVTTNFGRKKHLDTDGSPTKAEAKATAEDHLKEWDRSIEGQGRDEYT